MEQRRKTMLKGINIKETKEFVSTLDTAEPKTIFLIGNLTAEAKTRIMSGSVGIGADGNAIAKVDMGKAYEIVRVGLKGIKNFGDSVDGKSINIDVITDDVLNQIDGAVLFEIAAEIIKLNFNTDALRKN